MYRILLMIVFFTLLLPLSGYAAIELALDGEKPKTIDEIYLKNGVPYIALDDLLPLLGERRGRWNSVNHTYGCKIAGKKIRIAPQGTFFTVNDEPTPLEQPALFIDDRFRVSEDFIIVHLPLLLQKPIYYRNTTPLETVAVDSDELANDDIFSYLMQRDNRDGEGASLKVVIDPGHGGEDNGTFGGSDAKEKKIGLAIAQLLERQLKMRLDAEVVMMRDGDYTVPTDKRSQLLKEATPDLMVILHAQASKRGDTDGMALFIRPDAVSKTTAITAPNYSLTLARTIGKSALQRQLNVEGIIRANLLPLSGSKLPTVLVEMGYLTNEQDRIMLTDSEGQAEYAEVLFAGIKHFWENEIKEKTL